MPAQSSATADSLNAVSCPAVSFCLALGAQGPIPVTFEWNGSTWSYAPNSAGQPEESTVNAISCVSASYCVAAGYNFLGFSYGSQAAVWVWTGSRWTGGAVSQPSKWSYLSGVKCLSTTDCEVTGSQSAHFSYGFHPLAELWNGTTLTPQPVQRSVSSLGAVACVSASSCESVSSNSAARWNGHTWSAQTLPTLTGRVGLNGVSCYRTGCTAVGTVLTGTGSVKTLAEAWNGSAGPCSPRWGAGT